MTTSRYMLLNATIGRVDADPDISIYYFTAGPLTGPVQLFTPPAPPDGQIITIVNAWYQRFGFAVGIVGAVPGK